MGGQSNATGWYTPTSSLPSIYTGITSDIKFYKQSTNTFEDYNPVNVGINFNGSTNMTFSFEISFIHKIKEQYPDDEVYVIKYTFGGADISTLLSPTKTCFSNGKTKLDTIGNYRIEGFLWFQGESDANTQSEVDGYPAKLTDLIDHCKTLANNSTTFKSFIVRPGLRSCTGFETSKVYELEWREMIYNYCSGDTYLSLINSDDVEYPTLLEARIHVHGNGFFTLGMRAFNEYMNIDKRKYYDDESITRIDETTFTPDC